MTYNASLAAAPNIDNSFTMYSTEWRCYTFYFSTEKHKQKFDANLSTRMEWLDDSLSRRFHMPVSAARLAAFQLYMMVEGRCFKVHNKKLGKWYLSPSDVEVSVDVR